LDNGVTNHIEKVLHCGKQWHGSVIIFNWLWPMNLFKLITFCCTMTSSRLIIRYYSSLTHEIVLP